MEQKRGCCKEHGVVTPNVPWAYRGSMFTMEFDRVVAWLSRCVSKKAVSEFMGIDWATVGRCVSRVRDDLEPDLASRLDGLASIGIDETSYKKGHKYVTVIVNHDTEDVVWVHEGHGKTVLEMFYGQLTDEQKASIKVVTGDGARWIGDCVEKYTPSCARCMDSFHVVQWAGKALLPKKGKSSKGRPKKDDRQGEEEKRIRERADRIKGSSYAVGKAPEHLTDNQKKTLEMIRVQTPR